MLQGACSSRSQGERDDSRVAFSPGAPYYQGHTSRRAKLSSEHTQKGMHPGADEHRVSGFKHSADVETKKAPPSEKGPAHLCHSELSAPFRSNDVVVATARDFQM